MNLRRGSRSQRVLPIEGWDVGTDQWVPDISLGSMRANDLYITGTDYSLKKRLLACSDKDRIDPKYGLIKVEDLAYIIESENKNAWKRGAYQYSYQLRRADLTLELYRWEGSTQASGVQGNAARILQTTTLCDISGSGMVGSSEIEALEYSRYRLYTPDNVSIDNDTELDLMMGGEVVTLDVISVQRFNRMRESTVMRRGVPK